MALILLHQQESVEYSDIDGNTVYHHDIVVLIKHFVWKHFPTPVLKQF